MFDKEGFTLDWWERKDEEAFNNRTGCMVCSLFSAETFAQHSMYLIVFHQVDQYEDFPIMYKEQNFTTQTGGSLCELGFDLNCAGEDISDNGGVKTAYRAFQNIKGSAKKECIPGLPFSANQLFWVNQSRTCIHHPNHFSSWAMQWTGVLLTTSDIHHTKSS